MLFNRSRVQRIRELLSGEFQAQIALVEEAGRLVKDLDLLELPILKKTYGFLGFLNAILTSQQSLPHNSIDAVLK